MHSFLMVAGIALFVLMLPVLYRIIIGPTAIDRIVAVNIIGTKTAVLLVIIGLMFENVGMFVDLALAYAMLNFIASLAAARYFRNTRHAYADGETGEEGAS